MAPPPHASSMNRSMHPNGTNTSNGVPPAETFVLRATPSIKRYNIARFDTPTVPRFQECAQPIMMYREPEKVFEEDEEKKEDEVVGYNPALRKRRRRRRKNSRTANWVIEDNGAQHKFVGSLEGGQSSSYVLLVKNRQSDDFSVIPVEQWFRFKKPLSYQTLTLDEAEELNNEKKRAVERWLMRHKTFAEKEDGGDVVGAPRVRTGAVGGGARVGVKKPGEEEDNIFEAKEPAPRRRVAPARNPQGEEGTAMGEDGGDFDEKFDDDESEAEIEREDAKPAAESESDSEDELVVDGAGAQQLTETGQAMKDLLKRAQSGEMLDNSKENSEDGEGGSDDEEFSAQDSTGFIIRHDLGGNIIKVPVAASAAATSEPVSAGAEKATEEAANGKSNKPDTTAGKKHKPDEASVTDTPSKKAKTSTSSLSSSSSTRLTEAGVQQELIRYGGRMKMRDLLKKLKRLLATQDDKALLKDILRTICEVEHDAIEGNLLVLKSQFR